MHVVRLLAPQLDRESHTKDIDFSPSGIMRRWDAGYSHTKSVLERRPWVGEFDPLASVVLHEHMDEMAIAAEEGRKRSSPLSNCHLPCGLPVLVRNRKSLQVGSGSELESALDTVRANAAGPV